MNEASIEPFSDNSWVDIIGKVLDYYEKERQGTMFSMHGKTAYPVASLVLLKISPEEYENEDLAEAFKGVSEHLYAHLKNKSAKISSYGVPFAPDNIPAGESTTLDIALGRIETSPAELGELLLSNMEAFSLDDEHYHDSFKYWKQPARAAIDYMRAGIEIIPELPHNEADN